MKEIIITVLVLAVLLMAIPTGCVKLAEFEVTSLTVPSEPVEATSPVAVEVQVQNVGEVEGTYMVTLQVNEEEMMKDVWVGAGETEVVSFWVSVDRQGTYSVTVDGLADTIEVVPLPVSHAVLTLEDLPEDFAVITVDELGLTIDDFAEDLEEYGPEELDHFGFLSGELPEVLELIYGIFVYPLSAEGQADFDEGMSDPEQMGDFIADLGSDATSHELLPELSNIGDMSVGARYSLDADGVAMVGDIVIFRMDDILAMLLVFWLEELGPVMPTGELTETLETRLAEVVATR
jgi:hypothetical protein